MNRLLATSLIFFMCAPSPAMDRQIYIHRRYGPDQGQKQLRFSTGYLHRYYDDQKLATYLNTPEYVVDFELRQGLDENYSVIWAPLPTGIAYRFPPRWEDIESGGSWSLDFLNQGKLGVKPRFDSYFRKLISAATAIEIELEYFTFTPFRSAPNSLWTLDLKAGPLFQITDSFALKPIIEVAFNDNILFEAYPESPEKSEAIKTVFPLSLLADFQLPSGTHIGAEYSFRGLGLNQSFRTQILNLYGKWHW